MRTRRRREKRRGRRWREAACINGVKIKYKDDSGGGKARKMLDSVGFFFEAVVVEKDEAEERTVSTVKEGK
jgi:hypothetical protein